MKKIAALLERLAPGFLAVLAAGLAGVYRTSLAAQLLPLEKREAAAVALGLLFGLVLGLGLLLFRQAKEDRDLLRKVHLYEDEEGEQERLRLDHGNLLKQHDYLKVQHEAAQKLVEDLSQLKDRRKESREDAEAIALRVAKFLREKESNSPLPEILQKFAENLGRYQLLHVEHQNLIDALLDVEKKLRGLVEGSALSAVKETANASPSNPCPPAEPPSSPETPPPTSPPFEPPAG